MAYDDRFDRDRDRFERERGRDLFERERGQASRPHRPGDRDWRGPTDDPDYGMERYGGGAAAEFEANSMFGAPGYDAGFAGPRYDRVDVGSVGSHGSHPVASVYGADYRGAVGVPGRASGSSAREYAALRRSHDPHYHEWRSRQIEQLDRDYEEYRREHQTRFEREFGAWREQRGRQRQALGRVTEHMEVIGSDGTHVGTVDCTRGDRIILTRSDPGAGGMHHSIPCGWVDAVDDKVRLNLSAEDAHKRWRDEERSRALFEREDQGTPGPHILNRSFSGTYREGEE